MDWNNYKFKTIALKNKTKNSSRIILNTCRNVISYNEKYSMNGWGN
jgi:hypothetical protein